MAEPMLPTQLPAPEGQAGPTVVIQYDFVRYSRNQVSRRLADIDMTNRAKTGWRLAGPLEPSVDDWFLGSIEREVGQTLPTTEYIFRLVDARDITSGAAGTAATNLAASKWRRLGTAKPTIDNLHIATFTREV